MIRFTRKLLVKSGCVHCRKTIVPVDRINLRLPIEKRIHTVDARMREDFGIQNEPIIDKLLKAEGDAYPTLIIDGLKVTGFLSKSQVKAFLDGFLDDEKVIGDELKWT